MLDMLYGSAGGGGARGMSSGAEPSAFSRFPAELVIVNREGSSKFWSKNRGCLNLS